MRRASTRTFKAALARHHVAVPDLVPVLTDGREARDPGAPSAWHKSPVRNEYYYGVFWSGMPDLNYETPAVREEAKKVATFWLRDMDVDGFRLDAIPYLMEEGSTCLSGCAGTHAFFREYAAHLASVKPDA